MELLLLDVGAAPDTVVLKFWLGLDLGDGLGEVTSSHSGVSISQDLVDSNSQLSEDSDLQAHGQHSSEEDL